MTIAARAIGIAALMLLAFAPLAAAAQPVVIGIDADMSAGSAQSGEAIRRGAVLAVDEINAAGGLLGRPVVLEVRDHRGNPARGVANMQAFAETPGLLAVLGGLHTPVALEEIAIVHRKEIIFLIPWAAGTNIVENGQDPNYVFRVSVRDEYAGAFLIQQALRAGFQRPGLLLEQTGWGRSNEQAMVRALADQGLRPARVEWFHWGTQDVSPQLDRLRDARADVIMLVANAPEGLTVLRSTAARPERERLPIISHWGITGGDFPEQAGTDLFATRLYFLQTFSFLEPPLPRRAQALFLRYQETFGDVDQPRDVPAAQGTAHAYDLVGLLAQAVRQAGTLDRPRVRDALEQLDAHAGVMRDYAPPFTPQRHDALNAKDFRIACFAADKAIVPCAIDPK